MMITKDSIIRRNKDGSMFHHGAPVPIPGFGRVRDAVITCGPKTKSMTTAVL
jgi:hypothetical protein